MSAPRAAPRGLIERVRASYWDFAGAVRGLIAERPSEATLLSFLIIALIAHAFAGVIGLAVAEPRTDVKPAAMQAELQQQILEVLIGRILVGAIGVYLATVIVTWICRAFRGAGGYYETRVGVIWAVLVAAPQILLIAAVGAVGIGLSRSLTGTAAEIALWAASGVQLLLTAVAIAIFAGCVAGAHGFRSPARVLGVSLAIMIGITAVIWGALQL
ncbi:MAG: hypothetical protein MRY74_12580 [Neomegalonema sp.]|nr:hypothetical protein [Neomegalonema sp.]